MDSLMNEENSQPVEVEEVQRGIEVISLADQETELPEDKGLDVASETQVPEEQVVDENVRVRYCVRCHMENKFPLGERLVCQRCKFIIFYMKARFEDVGWVDDNPPPSDTDDDDDDNNNNIEDNEAGGDDGNDESDDNNDEVTAEKVNSENEDEDEDNEKEEDNMSNEQENQEEKAENDD